VAEAASSPFSIVAVGFLLAGRKFFKAVNRSRRRRWPLSPARSTSAAALIRNGIGDESHMGDAFGVGRPHRMCEIDQIAIERALKFNAV
jgi:hypothetical protein